MAKKFNIHKKKVQFMNPEEDTLRKEEEKEDQNIGFMQREYTTNNEENDQEYVKWIKKNFKAIPRCKIKRKAEEI